MSGAHGNIYEMSEYAILGGVRRVVCDYCFTESHETSGWSIVCDDNGLFEDQFPDCSEILKQ